MQEAITGRDSEILCAESFLGKVYDKTSKWLVDARGAKVIKMFDAAEVLEWERQSTYPPGEVTLGMDVKQALLARDTLNTYGIVLGKRSQSKYDREQGPSLLFGFLPNAEWVVKRYSEETPMEELRMLVNNIPHHTRRAEFYFLSDLQRMDVDCWIDSYRYGGASISSWERKDKIMSPKGEKAIVDTVKRLVRNYDPI